MKPAQNYKGLGGGPLSKRLVSARMPKPTILRADGGRIPHAPVYRPPAVRMRTAGKGSMGVTPMGLLSRRLAMDKAAQTQVVHGSKAGQGLDIAAQQLAVREAQARALGIDIDTPLDQGGM